MILSQQLSGKVFLLFILIFQNTFSQYRNWSILDQLDTLTLFANDQCAGTIISSIKADNANKKISTSLNYSIDPSISGMKLTEQRVYDYSGDLIKAKQILISASGTTKWDLEKIDGKQWSCKTTISGKSERIFVENINDNLIGEYNFANQIFDRSITVGEEFYDTVFDMMTRENFVLKTVCVKTVDKNNSIYEFELIDSKIQRSERWLVDTLGRTIEQDVPPIFVAKREKCDKEREPFEITDLWDMLKVKVPPCFQEVVVKFSAPQTLHPSISFLYEKLDNNSAVLNSFNASGVYSISSLNIDTKGWLDNSVTIQKDNKKIKRLAEKNAGTVRDWMLIVKNLTFFVYKYLDKKAVGTFSNAVETLEAGYGDCGEHAVLLAALLRSVNIPANVVLGLVTLPGKEGYFYHAWVAVPINNGVIFADAALGNAPATSGYIPLIVDPDGRGASDLVKLVGNIFVMCR